MSEQNKPKIRPDEPHPRTPPFNGNPPKKSSLTLEAFLYVFEDNMKNEKRPEYAKSKDEYCCQIEFFATRLKQKILANRKQTDSIGSKATQLSDLYSELISLVEKAGRISDDESSVWFTETEEWFRDEQNRKLLESSIQLLKVVPMALSNVN